MRLIDLSVGRALDLKEECLSAIVKVGFWCLSLTGDDERLERECAFVEENLPRVDCLGEVGLDYKDAVDEPQRRRQHDVLDRQLHLAAALRRPVSFHSRRAERPSVSRAAEFTAATGLGINLHWFTHSEKMAKKCGEAGVYISVGPAILWRPEQAKVADLIHPDFLLTETDCPVPFGRQVICSHGL